MRGMLHVQVTWSWQHLVELRPVGVVFAQVVKQRVHALQIRLSHQLCFLGGCLLSLCLLSLQHMRRDCEEVAAVLCCRSLKCVRRLQRVSTFAKKRMGFGLQLCMVLRAHVKIFLLFQVQHLVLVLLHRDCDILSLHARVVEVLEVLDVRAQVGLVVGLPTERIASQVDKLQLFELA
jgi:hypothetical protein